MDISAEEERIQPQYDVHKATSVAEIKAALAQLSRREASVTARLNALVASQKDLSRELGRLDLLRANLGTQVVNTRAISNGMLSEAASTANRISGAVKKLDQEQLNVKATLEVVEQVAELKVCVLGVHGSMGAPQDWETAAGYLHRASKIPAEVIDGSFAAEIVPTADVPDPPRVTLNAAAESLCGLFLREFEKAVKDGDGARITRFFKLFPLIGRSDVGLDAYGRYVCQGVAARARANLSAGAGTSQRKDGFFYANALTKLFEHIAQIVDAHEPLVERHYGPGMMVKVIARLQIEADVQGGIVLDTWSDERGINRRLTDVKSYAFSFLVQSFLPAQKPSTGTPRSGSPAKRDPGAAARNSEDEGMNMKEVDALLGETALMLGRWALYTRFLASKSMPPDSEDASANSTAHLSMPDFLTSSNLQKKVSKNLVEPFNVMSTFFFRRSVEKAFQLDESPADLTLNPNKPLGANPPFITSAVDDVMYIVNQVLQRTLATSQRTVVASVVPTIGRVLGSDFVGMIQRKMRDECYPKAAIAGSLPPENTIIAFLVLINNLDVATDYLKRIISSHIDSQPTAESNGSDNPPPSTTSLTDLFPFNADAPFVHAELTAMSHAFTTKTTELLNDGIQVMFHQVMKPRMRPILADAFRDVDYALTSSEPSAAAAAATANPDADPDADAAESPPDLVKHRFERGWLALTRPIKRIMTPRAFDKLLTTTLSYLARALEKRLWGFYGRVGELGAVRLERDVAGIVGVAVGAGRYGLRDAFARCSQMVLVMNMEEDEWEEVGKREGEGAEGTVWVLDAGERQRARAIVKERVG